MHCDHQVLHQEPVVPLSNQVRGSYMDNEPVMSTFGGIDLPPGVKHPRPFHGVEFQPFEFCPKNFIIVDQTDKRSQIMFHPAAAPKFCYPGLNLHSSCFQDNGDRNDAHNEVREISSLLKEDSDDIDALLSLEEVEEEEYDEEEVSTARSHENCELDSADSCSTYGSKTIKGRLSSLENFSSSGRSFNSERKRQNMRTRNHPGGGNRMSTIAVLDEAVRYLKSLKVEAQKIGGD
ncbi:transcription factor bHLH144 [Cornus florida]|uniref:transcription factor bHLH144 n=1 Tax=Cornus florida TaxID=4283 RepID=UPI00289892C5|nr:transcription factor bHLH144 [Cornus florida]XP_059665293.1 transcription factor bHLH144 [Cornus florida]XP_059665297.1 transcription factor bHLH144 [Cornus florida]